jgi:hypothetical protein
MGAKLPKPPVQCRGLLSDKSHSYNGERYQCEGQKHKEGGRAHSAQTPEGLLLWWTYGVNGGRMTRLIRS